MQDDKKFNCGRVENRTAGPGYASFCRRDRGYDEYRQHHNLAQKSQYLFALQTGLINEPRAKRSNMHMIFQCNVSKIRVSLALLTDRIEIHQSQPDSMT